MFSSANSDAEMMFVKKSIDWPLILDRCKDNVKNHIQPLLKTSKAPQPDLGVGAGGDKMKLVDLAAEKAIVETLLQNGLSFTLVSEESGTQEYGTSPGNWYVTVDPIDGTTNLIRGLPFYCNSIAVSDAPKLSSVFAACVTDLSRGATYRAVGEKGGAIRDGQEITTSSNKKLDEAVVGVDLNTYKIKAVAPRLDKLFHETKHVRHFGANALELCYVAEGLTDAFIDIRGKLRTTDVAAGFFIVKEAGGIVTTPDGRPVDAELDPKRTVKFVASGNKNIHEKILALVKP
jgi:myo-inositol-1(or 4)-monophosphatase